MFKTTSMLSVLSGLLFAAACARPAVPETRDGSVEFVSFATAEAEDAVLVQLTITGLDRPFHRHVELTAGAPSSGVCVALPAGLYAVDAAASVSSAEPVIPASSAPKLVVVAAGHVTTVNVRSLDTESQAVAALER
jgi:arginine exporter protein ArgO